MWVEGNRKVVPKRRMIMLSLKNELPLWRDISKRLDQLYAAKKELTPPRTCPFCGEANVQATAMETMDGPEPGSKVGFFTCMSCRGSWSSPIK
jgi:hypothetical protein